MPTAHAVELHIATAGPGSARLEIVAIDDHGDRFVIDITGPEAVVRVEAEFLAGQYHLAVA